MLAGTWLSGGGQCRALNLAGAWHPQGTPRLPVCCRPDPRRSIIEVGWEDSLKTVDHEEWCVAGGLARGRPQALEHHGKLRNPSSTKLVQPIEDPRLEAL